MKFDSITYVTIKCNTYSAYYNQGLFSVFISQSVIKWTTKVVIFPDLDET